MTRPCCRRPGPLSPTRSARCSGVTEVKSGVVIAGDGLQINVDPVARRAGGHRRRRGQQAAGEPAQRRTSPPRSSRARTWPTCGSGRRPDARARVDQMGGLLLKSPATATYSRCRGSPTIHVVTGQAEIERENMRRMDAVTARVDRPRHRLGGEGGAEGRRQSRRSCRRGHLRDGRTLRRAADPRSAAWPWCSPPRWRRSSSCCW